MSNWMDDLEQSAKEDREKRRAEIVETVRVPLKFYEYLIRCEERVESIRRLVKEWDGITVRDMLILLRIEE